MLGCDGLCVAYFLKKKRTLSKFFADLRFMHKKQFLSVFLPLFFNVQDVSAIFLDPALSADAVRVQFC